MIPSTRNSKKLFWHNMYHHCNKNADNVNWPWEINLIKLPLVAAGPKIGKPCLTAHTSGCDPHALRVTAVLFPKVLYFEINVLYFLFSVPIDQNNFLFSKSNGICICLQIALYMWSFKDFVRLAELDRPTIKVLMAIGDCTGEQLKCLTQKVSAYYRAEVIEHL